MLPCGHRPLLVTTAELRFGDLGPLGHVNNVALLAIIDESRRAVLGKPAVLTGSVPGLLDSLDDDMRHVLRHQVTEYERELWFSSSPLTVKHRVGRVGHRSFALSSTVWARGEVTPSVKTESTFVLIDAVTRTSRAIPDQLRARLECVCWQRDDC